jgi:hypothetical protein
MRPAILILSLGTCLAIARGAHAQAQPTVKLSYLRADSARTCPDEQTMRRGVAARLGRQPFDAQAERLLTVRLEGRASGYAVDITVQGAGGEVIGKRSLSTERQDCDELASAMQLAIAIAIDPLHNMPTPAAASETPAAPTPLAEAEPPAPPAPEVQTPPPAPPPPMPEPSSRHLGVGLLLAATTEPNPSIGLTVHYGNRAPHRAWAIEGRLDKPSEISAMSGQVRTSLFSASLLLCLRPSSLDLCALGSIGNLWGRGSGYGESQSFQTPYGAAGLRLGHHFAVHRDFAIQVSGDLLGRVNTTTLLVDDEEVWTSSRVEFGLGARAVWRIP